MTTEKIDFTIKPPKGYECACCKYWEKYEWDDEDFELCVLPEGAPCATWGMCNLEGHPQYINETYFSYGCNKHRKLEQSKSKIQNESGAYAQLSLF